MKKTVVTCDVCEKPANETNAIYLHHGNVDLCDECADVPAVARVREVQRTLSHIAMERAEQARRGYAGIGLSLQEAAQQSAVIGPGLVKVSQ